MKIANKISLSFLITAVILTGIAAPVCYIIARRNLEDEIFSRLSTIAQSRAHHIETFLETQKYAATQLSQSLVLEELLSASKQSPDYTLRFDRAMRRLETTEKANEFTYELFVIDKTGKIVASSDRSRIGLDKSTDIYFLGARKGPCIKEAYLSETTGESSLAFSAPITDSKTAEFLGVIVARANLDMLNEITFDKTGLGKTGEIYLVNQYGYMITPSRSIKDTFLKLKVDTENTRKCLEDIKKFGSKSHSHAPLIYRDYRGVKVLGIHDHIPQMKWGLLAEIDASEALAPLAKIKLLFVIIIIFVPISAWLTGTFVSRIISGPIHKLHIGTEIVGRGNLDYRVGMNTKDEIGQLSRAFDKMSEDLTESYKQLEEKVQERTAELSSTNEKLQEEIEQHSSAHKKLRQHIKQLNCLYELARLIEKQKVPLEQIFQETPNLIRRAYQYPDDTCVRITFEGIKYITDNFKKTGLSQYAPISVRGDKAGQIEVYYLGEKPESGRSLFLEEEHALLNAIAKRLGRTAERKKAGQTLQLFRNLIDRANDSIFVIEPEWGRFIDVNERACDSLGYTREELLNKSLKDVEESILDDSTLAEYVKKLKRKADLVIEGRQKRKDGTTFCVETGLKLVSREKEDYIIAVARDITERKKTEDALKESELKFRTIFENAGGAIFIADAQTGQLLECNSLAEELIGRTRSEILRMHQSQVHPKGEAEKYKEKFHSHVKQRHTFDYEGEVQHKDGRKIPVLISAEKMIIAEKDVLAGLFVDITERKRMEKAVRESEEKHKTLYESSRDAIMLLTPEQGFFNGNSATVKMFGCKDEEEFASKTPAALSPEYQPDGMLSSVKAQQMMATAMEKGSHFFEWKHKKVDGTEFFATVLLTRMKLQGKKVLQATVRDITERKWAEQRQDELLDEVESINQELKDFAYIVSHDLKAPLRGIKTLADWLVADYADKLDDNGREQMNLLLSRTQRMHNLIDGVLQYSRVGRAKEKKGRVNLNDLVSEVIDTVAPPENIEVIVENQMPVIECEETRITQVFQNLLGNGVKYMDKPQGRIRIGCVEENGFWNFSVADNGPGIEERHFERIFRIFQTLSPRDEFESTGVGLTVVKKIVELYGGKIWVESKLGEGSTFFFTLPSREMGVKNAKLEANIVSRR